MTKEELINLLKNYKENKAKLELRKREKKKCEDRLKHNKEIVVNITGIVGINSEIHSKNTISKKTEKAAIDIIEKDKKEKEEAEQRIKDLEKEIKELEDKVIETKIRLSALKYKEKEILYAYYVEERTYADIGNNLYFHLFSETRDVGTIKKIVEKAMQKMLNF